MLRDGAKVCVDLCSTEDRRFDTTRSIWRRQLRHRQPHRAWIQIIRFCLLFAWTTG
jgi:hypothetical protein